MELELNNVGTEIPTTEIQLETVETPSAIETPTYTSVEQPIETTAHGLSTEEIRDPNQIVVTVADTSTPIVVLFGPPNCGKTMTLIRLSRYLKAQGLTITPDRTFRPSEDENYKTMCDEFNSMVTSSNAAESTERMSFMLVKVSDKYGKPLCQILEAPGEYYFNPKKPQEPFPAYVQNIIHGNNRKIWCFMVEPNWKNLQDRLNYVAKIDGLKRNMLPRDKAIFVFNKIDMTNYVYSPGKVNIKEAKKDIQDHYEGIFVPFQSKGIFGTNDNFKFIPFQTGSYSEFVGGKTFTAGHDAYPKMFWEAILGYVRG